MTIESALAAVSGDYAPGHGSRGTKDAPVEQQKVIDRTEKSVSACALLSGKSKGCVGCSETRFLMSRRSTILIPTSFSIGSPVAGMHIIP